MTELCILLGLGILAALGHGLWRQPADRPMPEGSSVGFVVLFGGAVACALVGWWLA